MRPKRLNNLKIYCQTEEDQSNLIDFLCNRYKDDTTIKYTTWEPDVDVDVGSSSSSSSSSLPSSLVPTWGIFVDDFPPHVWDTLVEYLEGEDSWSLDESVEMALECDDGPIKVYKYYEWPFLDMKYAWYDILYAV